MNLFYVAVAFYLVIALVGRWLTRQRPGVDYDTIAPLSDRWLFWGFCVFWPIGWGMLIYFAIITRRTGGYPHD